MAVNVLEKIDDEFLSCMICLERFKQPKTLSCLHTFCSNCLHQHYNKNRSQPGVLSCPACRVDVYLKQDGVHSLPGNFFVEGLCEIFQAMATSQCGGESAKVMCSGCDNDIIGNTSFCMNCKEFLCRICASHHTRTKHTRDHQVVPGSEMESVEKLVEMRSQSPVTCTAHENESIKLYCDNCQAPVCVICSVTSHKGHQFSDATGAAETARNAILKLLSPAEQKVSKYQYGIDSAIDAEDVLEKSKHQAKTAIDEKTNEMIAEMATVLRKHAESLKDGVDALFIHKQADIHKFKEMMEFHMEIARNAYDYSRKVARYGNVAEVLTASPQMKTKLEKVNAAYPEPYKPAEKIEFAPKSRPSTRFQQSDVGNVGLVTANLTNRVPVQNVQRPQRQSGVKKKTTKLQTSSPTVAPPIPQRTKMAQPQSKQPNTGHVAYHPYTVSAPVQLQVYSRVQRGQDWEWGNQDGGVGSVGMVMIADGSGWVQVKWDNGLDGKYRMGYNNKYDLQLV